MKTKKNKLTKLLKIGILLFLISITFSSCEEETYISQQDKTIAQIKENISFSNFKNPSFISNQFIVKWDNINIQELDKSVYYEFETEYLDNGKFTLEGYSKQKSYSLLVFFDIEKNIEYHLVEHAPFNTSVNKSASYFNINDFSGMQYLYNIKGENLQITRFENGEAIERFTEIGKKTKIKSKNQARCLENLNFTKASKKSKKLVSKNNCGAGGGGCGTQSIATDHYKEWYDVETNNRTGAIVSVTYLYTEYINTTYQYYYACGGGGGSSNNNQNARIEVPVTPEGIDPEEFKKFLKDLESKEVPPSCKSFNYQQLNLLNVQVAAVQNMSFRIKYKDPFGNWHSSDVLFSQPVYFTIPRFSPANGGNLTTGRGANLSADALLRAHYRAKAYFIATDGNDSQVRAKIWEYIRDEMSNGTLKGGSASFTPPLGFNGNISQYQTTTIFGDNCN